MFSADDNLIAVKKVLIIFMAMLPFLTFARQPAFVPDSIVSTGGGMACDRFRIRFAEGVALPSACSFSPGAADTGIAELDAALDSVRATAICRVFSDGGRFAARRRRYGLHLWYEVKTDGSVPVEAAVAVFDALAAVAYAGPVYEAVLAE